MQRSADTTLSFRLRGLVLFVLLLSALPAAAQEVGFTVDQFRTAELASDGFAISRPGTLAHLDASAQLTLDYARSPLVLQLDGSDDEQDLIKDHLLATPVFALGLGGGLAVFVGVPVSVVMGGDGVTGADEQAVGDPILGARVHLLGEDGQSFHLGLQAALTLPVAELSNDTQRFSGERTVAFLPRLMAEIRAGDVFRLNFNLGARLRGASTVDAGLEVGSELTFGAGATVVAVKDVLDVMVEAYGATGFLHMGDTEETPLEIIGGVKIHPGGGFTAGLAGGTGLTTGYGSPEFRGVLQLGWSTPPSEPEPEPELVDEDRDRDGIANDVDGCPDDPEDVDEHEDADGCPDFDNDGDQILDADDAAPNDPEDMDGFEDEDGAPEADNDQDGVLDAADRCPVEAEDRDGIQDDDGCPETDADSDEIVDPDDHCPLTPGVTNERNPECSGCPALACMSEPGVIRILQRIEFETNSDVIRPESTPVLEAVKSVLDTNPQIRTLRVEGHTDDRGPDARNLDLSRRRAESVVRWLTEHGVDAGRLTSDGLGETRPLQPNTSNANRQANRRVEFHIADPAPPAEGAEAEPGDVRPGEAPPAQETPPSP